MISIHALRVEGDSTGTCSPRSCRDFYPRPPGGGRLYNRFAITDILGFLSTPSGWRATHTIEQLRDKNYISIHALRVEGDRRVVIKAHGLPPFLSTPSGWRATPQHIKRSLAGMISIHALRVEGDIGYCTTLPSGLISIHALRVEGDKLKNCPPVTGVYFYPRPPGGGRQAKKLPSGNWRVFLSTPSGWRATS